MTYYVVGCMQQLLLLEFRHRPSPPPPPPLFRHVDVLSWPVQVKVLFVLRSVGSHTSLCVPVSHSAPLLTFHLPREKGPHHDVLLVVAGMSLCVLISVHW